MKQIHLGFEVGTGHSVEIPLRNLAITGQTQESGKTTTLEALVSRADVPAIAFVTKRGEGSFVDGHRLQPYFRDRADWQFVTSIIDATLQEKNKFLRPWIMKICRNTRTLADVHREVRKALQGAKGINEGVYTQLDAYLDLIVPEIGRTALAKNLDLRSGLNVMDVSGYATPMQMLFVQSAIDWVNEHEKQTVVVVPEAWEFIPEGKGSPVKASAVSLVRKGSGIGNHIWVDSQDMAGVDKTILRGCPVWLIGVQREANEIKRNLSNIPAGIKKPSAADIAGLDRGQFYACWKDHTVKVYVQPAWCQADAAKAVAMGWRAASTRPTPKQRIEPQEETVTIQEANELRGDNEKLRAENRELMRRLEKLEVRPPADVAPGAASFSGSGDELYQEIKKRLMAEAPQLLKVLAVKPELTITVERQTVTMGGDSPLGRVARLISRGFFDEPRKANAGYNEAARLGFGGSAPRFYEACDKLHSMGFFTKDDCGFQAVPGMKVNIVEP